MRVLRVAFPAAAPSRVRDSEGPFMFLLRFLLLRSSVEAETKWAARPFEKQLFMFPKDGYYAQKPSLSTTNDSAPRPAPTARTPGLRAPGTSSTSFCK